MLISVFRRLSVQAGVVGRTLTTTAAGLAAAGVPGAAQVAVPGAILTAVGTVIGAAIPQRTVATYNPMTEDVMQT
ncbi:hypothetical protein ABAC402_12430 [Asticcacaulis sp. AC402]|nr:hypothetical protein ABAC402_12430 [Asticcacaulis sp. AC402]